MLGKFNFDLVADDLVFLFYSKCSQSWLEFRLLVGRITHLDLKLWPWDRTFLNSNTFSIM